MAEDRQRCTMAQGQIRRTGGKRAPSMGAPRTAHRVRGEIDRYWAG
ncbi:hypothetical protein O0544_06715 [Edwardsiella anguillarum]|nr:hypothetical protein [Edwardsiella anguillarum]